MMKKNKQTNTSIKPCIHFMHNIFESQTSVLFRFLIAIRLYKIEV